MDMMRLAPVLLAASLGLTPGLEAQAHDLPMSRQGLTPYNVRVERVVYRGVEAVRLIEGERDRTLAHAEALAVLSDAMFEEGVIELDVAGAPRPDAPPDMRGFIGLAFHVQPKAERFQVFYLRPTNGRADDQLRRNHATQYAAIPDWPWHRLRSEAPGVYESYADMEPGVWTHMRIVVKGTGVRLYLNDQPQPVLIVTDPRSPDTGGGLGLWIGVGTDGYFANLRVTPR